MATTFCMATRPVGAPSIQLNSETKILSLHALSQNLVDGLSILAYKIYRGLELDELEQALMVRITESVIVKDDGSDGA